MMIMKMFKATHKTSAQLYVCDTKTNGYRGLMAGITQVTVALWGALRNQRLHQSLLLQYRIVLEGLKCSTYTGIWTTVCIGPLKCTMCKGIESIKRLSVYE